MFDHYNQFSCKYQYIVEGALVHDVANLIKDDCFNKNQKCTKSGS